MAENLLRPCTYKGEQHYFHTWFQEGGYNPGTLMGVPLQEGNVDIGAILEDSSGQVKKVFDVEKIKFEVES